MSINKTLEFPNRYFVTRLHFNLVMWKLSAYLLECLKQAAGSALQRLSVADGGGERDGLVPQRVAARECLDLCGTGGRCQWSESPFPVA